MKKRVYSIGLFLLIASNSFAINPVKVNEKKASQTKSKKEIVVTVTCSRTVNGVTWTTTAGNWFSTTEGANRRCESKLDAITQY